MSTGIREAAALLDEKVPGWENLVDTGTLDMTNECNCVLGQLARRKRWRGIGNPYEKGLRKLFGSVFPNDPRAREFWGSAPNRPWREAIRRRRAQA